MFVFGIKSVWKRQKKFRLPREQPTTLEGNLFCAFFGCRRIKQMKSREKLKTVLLIPTHLSTLHRSWMGSEMTKDGRRNSNQFRAATKKCWRSRSWGARVSTLARDFLALSSCRRQATLSRNSRLQFSIYCSQDQTRKFFRHPLPITRDFRKYIFFVVKSVAENRFPFSVPAHTLAADKILRTRTVFLLSLFLLSYMRMNYTWV